MNDRRAARIGVACTTTGLNRYRCTCPTCQEFRDELAHWNRALASQHLAVDRGTPSDTAARQRRWKRHRH